MSARASRQNVSSRPMMVAPTARMPMSSGVMGGSLVWVCLSTAHGGLNGSTDRGVKGALESRWLPGNERRMSRPGGAAGLRGGVWAECGRGLGLLVL